MPKLKSKLHKELNEIQCSLGRTEFKGEVGDKLKAAFQKRETEIIEILKVL
jgi:hypothetical protein